MSQSHEQGNASGQALKLSILFTVAVVGLLAVIFVGSKSLKTTVANNEEAVAARIQKVGSVSIQAAAQAALDKAAPTANLILTLNNTWGQDNTH